MLRSLESFRGEHEGGAIVVCGCGASLNELTCQERFITIGVNDVGRRFDPNYLVVLNQRSQFTGDRFHYVEQSRAEYLFTQFDLGVRHPGIVRFRLGRYGGTTFSDPNVLHYTRNSPYVAICLAAHMGARLIGVIGVDFTDHHFFARTGPHPLAANLKAIEEEYRRLGEALAGLGIRAFNLSPQSRLTAWPRMSLEHFRASAGAKPQVSTDARAEQLNIVSYATTPIAGVPAILARCISARTPHRARCVWANRKYANGVAFEGDIEWACSPREAEAALAAADVVIVHNGKIDPRHRLVLDAKPTVTMAHNYMWNVDARLVSSGFPGVVIGQYQATLAEFAGWDVVPNPLPFWEPAFQPDPKPATPTICYTPSGKHERYAPGHRLYWHAKGYDTTMRVLDRLAARHGIRREVIRDGQISHSESLAMKRRAHVVIDECVTGSYHRNSLEGLSAGCVVVNGVGLLPGVVAVARRCAPGSDRLPFAFSRLEDLEATLTQLIHAGVERLERDGHANREWVERHWDFGAQWGQFWWPAIARAIECHRRHATANVLFPALPLKAQGDAPSVAPDSTDRSALPTSVSSRRSVEKAALGKVSAVVPHGGIDRLSHLTTTLAMLRQCEAVGEIIVAELGEAPTAESVVRRWADNYTFVRKTGAFERARALNVGSGLARCELVLWIDNDLLTPPPFIARAAKELNDRRLDYLIPYTSVRYLSEADSLAVMNGSRNPADCTPSRILYSGRRGPACSGGAGLVRREFLLRYGGLIEGFRGWGGEDNAWNRKVGMLGRAAPTTQADQHLYHLFHISSGGYLGHTASADNPQYTENLALLQRICAIRDSRQLLQQFPPRRSPPWSDACRIAVLTAPDAPDQASAGAVARALSSLYGDTVEEVLILPDNAWRERCVSADATVVFRKAAAWHAFGDGDASELRRRSVVVIDERDEAGIVAHFPSRHRILPLRMTPEHAIDPEQVAALLVGPLSLIVADASLDPEQPATIRVPRAQCLPVWTYWEGPCPDWIEACRRTIVKHAPDVRLLGPDDIDRLRDRDRDIGLSHLATAHRSDFMRAFLLARYGGLWIDSDCLVMKPLQPVLALLREHDFVAHRERSGYVSNGFIGARVGSRIARAFYARLCSILRLRQPLGWISLGGQPLTEILNRYVGCWYELECKKVQPICWSSPGVFFARGEPRTHEQRFDTEALCYMLSNTEITKHAIKHPADQLTDPDTFFSFVLNKALGDSRTIDASSAQSRLVHRPAAPVASLREIFAEFVAAYRRFGDESLSGPGSSMAQTAELRGRLPLLVADLGIQSLLDAPCGDFHWMREVELCLAEYIGVDFLEELVVENERRYGTPGRRFLCLDIREAPLPATDCVLCRDCLVHLSFADIYRTLRNFKSSRARYLFTTTFTSRRKNEDALDGAWRPLNFELPPFAFPKPLRLLNEKCSEAGGAFRDKSLGLWRLEDLPL